MATASLSDCRPDEALRQSPIPALRQIRVDASEQQVVLTGSVSSYYLKQMAQETVMPALGTRVLLNRVTVERV
jgi:osmotically-inducible protein OsmY